MTPSPCFLPWARSPRADLNPSCRLCEAQAPASRPGGLRSDLRATTGLADWATSSQRHSRTCTVQAQRRHHPGLQKSGGYSPLPPSLPPPACFLSLSGPMLTSLQPPAFFVSTHPLILHSAPSSLLAWPLSTLRVTQTAL